MNQNIYILFTIGIIIILDNDCKRKRKIIRIIKNKFLKNINLKYIIIQSYLILNKTVNKT